MEPSFLFGSTRFDLHNVNLHLEQMEDLKRFGKTYALYEGTTPMIRTIDPEFIKVVVAKEFDSFTDMMEIDVR